MMLKISLLTQLIVCLCMPAMARTTGDPLDTNDGPQVILVTDFNVPGCDNAEAYPNCKPCWTQCLYSLIACAWTSGGWNNGDNW